MTQSVRESIYQAISSIRLIDPHTHINPHDPASSTLADILGYHYYTELIHSAGMPREEIEEEGMHPRELVRRLVQGLPNIENTANYQWLIAICRAFFGFEDTRIDQSNWETLYDAAEERMNSAQWPQMVLDQSNVEAVFLTNDFDDKLEGFDTNTYIPCLRTDDLVFHLAKPETRQRLEFCTGIELNDSLNSLRDSLEQRFQHFVGAGARACAISIPPSFEPLPISDGRAATALDEVLRRGTAADQSHQVALSRRVFWTLAELCDHYGLPFDLMIGVNRGVYPGGVYQGQDLFDSRVSLIQYRELFNTFRKVKFPVSVLASVTNQELVSYSWIFPNLITNGHWWYSNTPSFIARDAAARLEAVPRNNQIGYYSDAYKLEFVWPKFDMYRQILAGILADHFVGFNGWSEERAIELGRQVLRDNVDETFPPPADPEATTQISDTYVDDTVQIDPDQTAGLDETVELPSATAAATAALAAGAIGIVEVHDSSDVPEDDYAGQETLDVAVGDQDVTVEDVSDDVAFFEEESPAQLEEIVEEAGFDHDEGGQTDYLEEDVPVELEDTVEQVVIDDDEDGQLDYLEEDAAIEEDAPIELEEKIKEVAIDDDDDGQLDYLEEDAPVEIDDTVEEVVIENDEDGQLDYLEESPTTVEETLEDVGDVGFAVEGVDEYDTVDEQILPDLPTTVDTRDTVRIDEVEDAETDQEFEHEFEDEESPVNPSAETVEIDQLPTDDEIEAVDVPDIELREPSADSVPDVDDIEAEVDDSPLYVGDILDEDDDVAIPDEPAGEPSEEGEEEIRMLRGDASFVPDEETMQLTRDPVTGELMFPIEDDDEVDSAPSSPDSVEPEQATFVEDVELLDEDADDDSGVVIEFEETIDLNEEEPRD